MQFNHTVADFLWTLRAGWWQPPKTPHKIVADALRSHYQHCQHQKWQSACRQVGRLQRIKEELTVVAWHPDRFLQWCLPAVETP
jgi:hypothetical protein